MISSYCAERLVQFCSVQKRIGQGRSTGRREPDGVTGAVIGKRHRLLVREEFAERLVEHVGADRDVEKRAAVGTFGRASIWRDAMP